MAVSSNHSQIHEKYMSTALDMMAGLAKRVRREDLQLFRVALHTPLHDSSRRHLLRVFPSGLVITITERCIIANAQATAIILEWFAKTSKAKSNYKILLRPEPERYFRELYEAATAQEMVQYRGQSLLHLRALKSAAEKTDSPLTGTDDDGISSSILSPLSSSVYAMGDETASLVTNDPKEIAERDARLLDFFGAWSSSQIDRFRKFVALTDAPRPKGIGNHVDLLTCKEFMKVYNIIPKESLMSPALA